MSQVSGSSFKNLVNRITMRHTKNSSATTSKAFVDFTKWALMLFVLTNFCAQAVLAQIDEFAFDGPEVLVPEFPRDTTPSPTPPPPPPPPAQPSSPTFNPPPFIPPRFTQPAGQPIVVPSDVTGQSLTGGMLNPAYLMGPAANAALQGIRKIDDINFPRATPREEDPDGLLVKWRPDTKFTRPQNNIVKLVSGEILVSVKNPAKKGILNTPFGVVALEANAVVMASYENGILRIKNLDGIGQKIKIKLNEGNFAHQKPIVVTVAPGYEFVAGDHTLNRRELRPKDGIARRFVKVLEQGQVAIGEFSLASALDNSSILVDLKQSVSGVKERRVLSDMTKMAAVLNYQMGAQGFRSESGNDFSQLANSNSGKIN